MSKNKKDKGLFQLSEILAGVIIALFLITFLKDWTEEVNCLTEFLPQEANINDPASDLFVFNNFYVPDYTLNLFFQSEFKSNNLLNANLFESNSDKEFFQKDLYRSKEIFLPKTIYGKLEPGENLYNCLKRYNIPNSASLIIIKKLKEVLNVKKLKPGEEFEISFNKKGQLSYFKWQRGDVDIYKILLSEDNTYKIYKEKVYLEKRIIKVSGKITGGLIDSFLTYGLRAKLARDFADIFSTKIDFNTDIKSGDNFKIIFEEYFKNNKFVGFGKILAAEYCSSDGPCISAFYFKGENMAQGSYFTREGNPLSDSFLRSPLKVYRLTSGFSYKRYHPILKVYRPHYGVDLAAPIGTPVMAVADGVVTFTGWQRGYGRIVILKHDGGYKTYYGHLLRFAKGIKKGVAVRQKQVIGYVGRSGYATGPHLDYRVKKYNKFINPFRARFSVVQKLIKKDKKRFLDIVRSFQKIMNNSSITGIVSVKKKIIKDKFEDSIG